MGICAAKAAASSDDKDDSKEQARTQALDDRMEEGRDKDAKINKLLLLGAGESGKSTLFKQMMLIYSKTKTQQNNRDQIDAVFNTIFQCIKDLCQASRRGHGEPETDEAKEIRVWIEELKDERFTAEDGQKLKTFWEDPGIQRCFEQRTKFRSNYFLPESASYFLNDIEKFTAEGWEPTPADYLRVRVRTTGIVEHNFSIGANPFQIFDVGGQRNERKKWIHCFENVTAVLFVAAISEFDQVLYEDESTNRMDEALNLFQEMANSEYFKNTAMILFLNKKDLFQEKIATLNITDSACEKLQTFTGDCRNFSETTEFMQSLFTNLNEATQTYPHITCATDTNNIERVFTDVKDVIIQNALDNCGWS